MKKIPKIIAIGIGIAILAACASMTLISLETAEGPDRVRQGTDLDPRSVTVWGIYKDESRKVVSINAGNISFNKHATGFQTVRVRVKNQEASFQTEVMALRSLTISSPPRTAIFKVGQEPDRTWPGLEIRGEWDQMGSDRIAPASCAITGYNKDQVGKQTVRVTYEGASTTFDVDFRAMTGIKVIQAPTKLDYAQGEPLDLTGLQVTGIWEGFPEEQLSISAGDVTGFNPNGVGIQRLTITKNGRSATFNVEIMTLTSIVLEKPPDKTDYRVGEPLELTGIIVHGNYTGTVATKKMTQAIPENQLAVSGYDPNRVGRQQKITVTVMGQIANFFVNVDLPDPNTPVTQTVLPAQTTLVGTWGSTTEALHPSAQPSRMETYQLVLTFNSNGTGKYVVRYSDGTERGNADFNYTIDINRLNLYFSNTVGFVFPMGAVGTYSISGNMLALSHIGGSWTRR